MKEFESYKNWKNAIDRAINQVLKEAYEYGNWDEDFITRTMLTTLKKDFAQSTIEQGQGLIKYSKCTWDVYKNTAKNCIEHNYGDIGILIQLHLDYGVVLEGVAFLEAKRIYHGSNFNNSTFKKLNKEQLEIMCHSTPYHRTILYDIFDYDGEYRLLTSTLPSWHALKLNTKSRDLHNYSELFSDCLIRRYMNGYELDFRLETVSALKKASSSKVCVNYLFVAQTSMKLDIDLNLENVNINKEVYEELGNDLIFNNDPDDNEPGPSNTNDSGMSMGM